MAEAAFAVSSISSNGSVQDDTTITKEAVSFVNRKLGQVEDADAIRAQIERELQVARTSLREDANGHGRMLSDGLDDVENAAKSAKRSLQSLQELKRLAEEGREGTGGDSSQFLLNELCNSSRNLRAVVEQVEAMVMLDARVAALKEFFPPDVTPTASAVLSAVPSLLALVPAQKFIASLPSGTTGVYQEEKMETIQKAGTVFTDALKFGLLHTLGQPRLINQCVVEWASVAETLEYVAQGVVQDWQLNRRHAESIGPGRKSATDLHLLENGGRLIVSEGIFKDAVIDAIRAWCREPSQELIDSLDAIQSMQRENNSTRLPSSSRTGLSEEQAYVAVEVDEDGVPRSLSQYESEIQHHQSSVRSASKEMIDRLSVGLDIIQECFPEEYEVGKAMVSETNLGAAHFMKRLGKIDPNRNLDEDPDYDIDDDDSAPTGDILSTLAWVAEYESLVSQASQSNQISKLEVSPEYEALRTAAVDLERSYIRKAKGMLRIWVNNISDQSFSRQTSENGEERSSVSRMKTGEVIPVPAIEVFRVLTEQLTLAVHAGSSSRVMYALLKSSLESALIFQESQVEGNRSLMSSSSNDASIIEKCGESANGIVQIPNRFEDLLLTLREMGLDEAVYKAVKKMSLFNRLQEFSFGSASRILHNFVNIVMKDVGSLYERDWWEPLTNPKVAKADEELALETFEAISPTVIDYLEDIKGLLDDTAFQISVVGVLHSLLTQFFSSIINSRAIARAKDLKPGTDDAREFHKTLSRLIKGHIREIKDCVAKYLEEGVCAMAAVPLWRSFDGCVALFDHPNIEAISSPAIMLISNGLDLKCMQRLLGFLSLSKPEESSVMEHAREAGELIVSTGDHEPSLDSSLQILDDSFDHNKEWKVIEENERAASDTQKTSWIIKLPLREVKITSKGGKISRQSTLDPRLAKKKWQKGVTMATISRTLTTA